MNNIDIEIKKVKEKLSNFYKKRKVNDLLKGMLLLVLSLFVILFFLSTLELLGLHSVEERSILFYFGIAFFITAVLFFVIFPTTKLLSKISRKDYLTLAQYIGEHFSEIDDKLLNTFQLYEEEGHSELKDAAILSQLKSIEHINFN